MQTISQIQILNLLKNTYCFADEWGTYFWDEDQTTETTFTLGDEYILRFEGAVVQDTTVTFMSDDLEMSHKFLVLVDITALSLCEVLND